MLTDDFGNKGPRAIVKKAAADEALRKASATRVMSSTPISEKSPLTPDSVDEPSSSGVIMATLVGKTCASGLQKAGDGYNIRVITKSGAETVTRSYQDVVDLHHELCEELKGEQFLGNLSVLPPYSKTHTKDHYRLVYNYIHMLFQCANRKALESGACLKFFKGRKDSNEAPCEAAPAVVAAADKKYAASTDSTPRTKASAKLFNLLGRYI